MMPQRLAYALVTLQGAVVRSRAVDVLGRLRPYSTASRPEVHAVMQVFADLTAGQAQFGRPERDLLEALQLDVLLDTGWWARLVTALSRATMPDDLASSLVTLCARLEMVASGFTALAALLDKLEPEEPRLSTNPAALTLSVSGEDGRSPSLEQVGRAIEAVNQLWSGSEMLSGTSGTLYLMGVDPGPETMLHFDGETETLEELRGLLGSVLEQTDRLPNVAPEQHAALVPPMLPVLERIGRSGRADAMRVRNGVEVGIRNLLQARCSLNRMEPVPGGLRAHAAQLPVHAPTEFDLAAGHLAQVIADERRQLLPVPEGLRQTWPASGAARAL